jgi:YesN/AraC family two-component response regulator
VKKQIISLLEVAKLLSGYLEDAENDWLDRSGSARYLTEAETLFRDWLNQAGMELKQLPVRSEIIMAIQYIREHLADKLSSDVLAVRVHLSPSRFRALFRNTVGESLVDFINRMRINEAQRLLRETNYLVSEIAERVGLPNQRYFSQVFRHLVGETPREYRKKTKYFQ